MNTKHIWFLIGLIVVILVFSFLSLRVFATQEEKSNICHNKHWNNEDKDPEYEGIQVNNNSLPAHLGLHGDFYYFGELDQNGKPDNKDKKADNWCNENIPQEEVTPTSVTPTDTQEEPTPTKSECEDCEVTPTEEVRVTPTVQPTTPPAGHGDGLSDGKSSCPECTQTPEVTLIPCTENTCGRK